MFTIKCYVLVLIVVRVAPDNQNLLASDRTAIVEQVDLLKFEVKCKEIIISHDIICVLEIKLPECSFNLKAECLETVICFAYNVVPEISYKIDAEENNLVLSTMPTPSYFFMSKMLYLALIIILTAFSPVLRKVITKDLVNRDNLKIGMYKDMYSMTVLNAIKVGVIVMDTNMNITFMNWSAGQICSCLPKDTVGKTINDAVRLASDGKTTEYTKCSSQRSTTLHVYSGDGRYLDIQVSASRINGTTSGTVILLQDVTATREHIRELTHKSLHDPLTGLPNRVAFKQSLRRVMKSASGIAQNMVVYLDLDGFKQVNDSSGHAAGDALLKQLAQLMKSSIRKRDFIARLGGDEFGLILYDCGFDKGKCFMERLVSKINNYAFIWDNEVRYVGASVGITCVDVNRSDEEIVAQADKACYNAKQSGKGRVCFFESNLSKLDGNL